MDISDKVESIGGSGSSAFAAGGFGIGLFLMAIFLVVLFSLFCRNGKGCGYGHQREEGCADKLTWARYANFADPEVMRNHIEQIKGTGEIRRDIALENGEIKASIDRQTRDIQLEQERTTGAIIASQNQIAREQERFFFTAELNRKNDAMAKQRERINTLNSQLMAAEAAREADRRQMETMAAMHAQFANISGRLHDVECNMVKAPTFYPYGGIASVNMCGYNPCHSGCGNNG